MQTCNRKHRDEGTRSRCPICGQKQKNSTTKQPEKLAEVITMKNDTNNSFNNEAQDFLNDHAEDYRSLAQEAADSNIPRENTHRKLAQYIAEDFYNKTIPGLIYHDDLPESNLNNTVNKLLDESYA